MLSGAKSVGMTILLRLDTIGVGHRMPNTRMYMSVTNATAPLIVGARNNRQYGGLTMIYVLRCRKPGETQTVVEEVEAPEFDVAVKVLAKKWPGIELVTFIGTYAGGKEVLA